MAEPALAAAYDGVVCDLDGVVRRGTAAVPHAVERLTALTVPVVYATNNASLTPADVATQLRGLGVEVTAADVVTSSQAGAAYVAGRVAPGSAVLAVGGPGVAAALTEGGLTPVTDTHDGVVAVLQGYGPAVTASDLARAAYAVQAGALWVATNRDSTLPTQYGVAPGNGALIAAVALATGTEPVAVGKPEPPLYDLAVGRLGCPAGRALAIGDRLKHRHRRSHGRGTGLAVGADRRRQPGVVRPGPGSPHPHLHGGGPPGARPSPAAGAARAGRVVGMR